MLQRCLESGYKPSMQQWMTIISRMHVSTALTCVKFAEHLQNLCVTAAIRRQHKKLFKEVVSKVDIIPRSQIDVLMSVPSYYLKICLNRGLDPNIPLKNRRLPLEHACVRSSSHCPKISRIPPADCRCPIVIPPKTKTAYLITFENVSMSSLTMRRASNLLEDMFIRNPCRETVESFICNNVLSVLTDSKAAVTTTNQAFDSNARDTIIGKNCNCLQKRGDTRNDISNIQIRNALRQNKSVVTHLINYNSDGHEYLVVISIRPIFNSHGNLQGYYSLQIPILHVTPYKDSLPILIPPSERHPYRRFYETDYTQEDTTLIKEIDLLFPDIVGIKREAILKKKEETYLRKRLHADEKAKTRQQMTMDIFEGYQQFIEGNISSDPDSDEEEEEEVPAVTKLPALNHPLVFRLKALTENERLHQIDDLCKIAASDFFEAVSAADIGRCTFLLNTLSTTNPPLLDINVSNDKNFTACHIAAHRGDLDMLKLLVARGADLLTHRWHYTVWAHALNSISKGLGCTQQILDWLKINGADNLAIRGDKSLVNKYTNMYQEMFTEKRKSMRGKKKHHKKSK